MAQQYQVDIVTKVVGASSIAKLEKSLDGIAAKQNKADKAFQKSVQNLKRLNGAYQGSAKQARDVERSLNGLKNAAVAAQSRGLSKLQTGMQNMQGAFLKFAGAIAGAKLAIDGFVGVMQAGFERDVAEQKLKNLSTSADEYKRSLDFVKESADKFLITQTSATQQFGDLTARLKPLGVEMGNIENVFTSLNYLAAQNGVSAEDAAGAMLQLSQAMGAGKLNGENLVTIMERMPQLGAAIASEMGVAAGSLYQLGADGKITTDILLKAFNSIAEGAGKLNIEEKLTPAQLATRKYQKAVEDLSVALAESLLPVLTPMVEGFTGLVNSVTPLVGEFQDLSEGVANLANPFRGLTEQLEAIPGAAEAAAYALKKLVQAALDLIPGLKQVRQAFQIFDFAVEKTNQLTGNLEDNKAAVEQLKQPVQEVAETLQSVEPPAKQVQEAMEKTVEPTTKTAEAAKKLETNTKGAAEAQEKVEKKVKETVSPTKELAKQNAELEKKIILQNAAMQQQNQLVSSGVSLTGDVVKNEEAAQQQALLLAQNQAIATEKIVQSKVAAAELKANLEGAASASAGIGGGGGGGGGGSKKGSSWTTDYSGQIYDKYKVVDGKMVETTEAERQAQMAQARVAKANTRNRLAQVWDLSTGGNVPNFTFGSSYQIGPIGSVAYNAYMQGMGKRASNYDSGFNVGAYMQGYDRHEYAEGGYVTGPQDAIVGEGGEPEYIIPASKMSQAMSRYSSGMRGEGVIPKSATVNVSYNGSTVNMGGSDYIKRDDVPGLLSSAVNQTLTTLKKSPRARLESGLR